MADLERSDHDLLIEMNAKLDLIVNSNSDHENRLRVVELKVYRWSGVATVTGAILGFAVNRLQF